LAFPARLVAQESDTTMRSTRDGVYTEEQAERGEALYTDVCLECHKPREFARGSYLEENWVGRTLVDLYWFLRDNMPEDAPGFLRPEEYVDAIAYILSSNRLPPGDSALTTDETRLARIRIEKRERSTPSPSRPRDWWRHEER
jgi:mono/diheme cytochrome c family protein